MANSTTTGASKKIPRRRIIALAILFMLAMFPTAYFLNKKATDVKKKVEEYQQWEKMDEEYLTPAGKPPPAESFVINEISVPLPHQDKPALIKVYWHPDQQSAILIINSLTALPPGEKYQVWAIGGGSRRSLGLFDAPEGDHLVVPVEKSTMTDSYGITVVKV